MTTRRSIVWHKLDREKYSQIFDVINTIDYAPYYLAS